MTRWAIGRVCGSDRSGDDEQPLRPVRQGRADRRGRAARARADHPAGRLGRARRRARSGGARGEVIDGALAGAGARARRGRGDRDHQPARDDRGVGPRERRADPQRDRLAGHAHRPARARARAATPAWTACASASGCRCRRTSPAPRSPGCSTTSTGARERAERGELRFGTIDAWLLWNLTGGPRGGVHATDVTNASRTMLMDLRDARLARAEPGADGHPARAAARDPLLERGLRRGGRHGARRPAGRGHPRRPAGGAVRPDLLRRGEAKNTYGTGSFLLVNTGERDRALRRGC